ncbi:MAG: ferredoxin family protein [Clostridia bacterium]|nr:ferredoxin family protein [Clostridia bacterium]
MSIRIEKDKCVGCGRCSGVCPGSLISKDGEDKAYIRFPKDCWGCTACLKECRTGAIRYFLGADIGGKGSTLHIKREKDLLHWHIIRPGGEVEVITINQKESNKY